MKNEESFSLFRVSHWFVQTFSSNLSSNYCNSTTLGKAQFQPQTNSKDTKHIQSHAYGTHLLARAHIFLWDYRGCLGDCARASQSEVFRQQLVLADTSAAERERFPFFQLPGSPQICSRCSVKQIQRLFKSSYLGDLKHFIYETKLPTQSMERGMLLPRVCNSPLLSPFSSGTYAVLNLEFKIKMM